MSRLSAAAKLIEEQLSKIGMLGKGGVTAAERIQQVTNAPAAQRLKNLSVEDRNLLQQAVPGAVMAGAYTLMGGGGLPVAGLSALADVGLSYGGMKLAGKFAPGQMATIRTMKNGKPEYSQRYITSTPQDIAGGLGTVGAALGTAALMPMPQEESQAATTQQQNQQRAEVNELENQIVAPGTNFQLQGIPYRDYLADMGVRPY